MSESAAGAPADGAADRYERGLQKLSEVVGEPGLGIIAALSDVAPDLGRYIGEFLFAETYSRRDLQPQERQLVTLGVLSALGGVDRQVALHVNASLRVGLTPEQIVGAFLQAAPFVGIPRAVNAVLVAKQVFSEHGLLPLSRPVPS